MYAQFVLSRSPPLGPVRPYSRSSGYSTPTASGHQTPREQREERWRLEAEAVDKPGKLEMREMYKELGGRKAKTKSKIGGATSRDKGGWVEAGGFDEYL